MITGTVFRQRVPQWATAGSDIKVKPHMVEQYFYHPLKSKLGGGGEERQTDRHRERHRGRDRQTDNDNIIYCFRMKSLLSKIERERETDRLTDRQRQKETDGQTDNDNDNRIYCFRLAKKHLKHD